MADVASTLEANGLPKQFESSSTQPEVAHSTTNSAAVISNAEMSQIKQDMSGIDVTETAQPVQPIQEPEIAQPIVNEQPLAQESCAPQVESTVQMNGHHEPESVVNAPSESPANAIDTVMTEPTSQQAPESDPILDQPIHALPDQAPISDLRSPPHADALPPEEVAKIEEQKHQIDNNAAPAPPEPISDPMDIITDSHPEQTLPARAPSPPPAPQPAHAELPSEPNRTVLPTIENPEQPLKVEAPVPPAPTPAEPAASIQPSSQDQEMTDATIPTPLGTAQAIKHERDEDMSDEPVAKRAKTDDEHEDTPLADLASQPAATTATPSQSTTTALPDDPEDVVTPMRLTHMKRIISNLKKSHASSAFRVPVDYVTLKIPTYPDIVKNPMDLGTIDDRLKHGYYQSVGAFKNDFNQIVTNCILFNGQEHTVTQAAKKMEASFVNQMQNLPAASEQEQTKAEKKAARPKVEPIRAPQPRRQSVNTKAASPKAPSPATFAPDPNGMPLIRRDSALDGRPKRAIVPTKRNSDFGVARPKKKKYELELRFCDEALKVISSNKYWQANQYFTYPVDPVALNIPTYFQIVKKPMDLNTVRSKLDNGMYEKAKDFEEDVRLIFKNCYKFNQEGDYVYQRGQELEKLFNQEWAKKADWISAREPDSEPASVNSEDEEDEAEADSDEDEGGDEIARLQAQLELMQNQMAELKKKKKSPGAKVKKDRKEKKSTSKFPGLAKDKSKKPAKKEKTKERYVTFAEKQYISNGIAMLPERPMQDALRIIQSSVPQLANSDSGEIELDIEEVPNHALLKLLAHVRKYAGPPPEETKEVEYPAPTVTKKSKKSMSKYEQEAHIAELKGQLSSYDNKSSPDAIQSIETGDTSDDDEDQSSEEE